MIEETHRMINKGNKRVEELLAKCIIIPLIPKELLKKETKDLRDYYLK